MTTVTLFRDDPDAEDYPAGQTIFKEGDEPTSMYAVGG